MLHLFNFSNRVSLHKKSPLPGAFYIAVICVVAIYWSFSSRYNK